MNPQVAQAIMIAVHFVVSLGILLLMFLLLRWLFLKMKHMIAATQNNAVVLFISFGAAAILFAKTLNNAIKNLIEFSIFPMTNITQIFGGINTSKGETLSGKMFLFSWAKSFVIAINTSLLEINYPMLLLMLAVWLALAWLISFLINNIQGNTTGAGNGAFVWNDNPIVKNILTFSVLIVSIYLCIGAIVSVPELEKLKEPFDKSASISNFEKELEKQTTTTIDKLTFPEEELNDSITSPKMMESMPFEISHFYGYVRETINDYNQLVSESWNQDLQAKQNALNKFRAGVKGKISKDQMIQYEADLIDWYQTYHQLWTAKVTRQRTNLKNVLEHMEPLVYNNGNWMRHGQADSTQVMLSRDGQDQLMRLWDDLVKVRTSIFAVDHGYAMSKIPEKQPVGDKFGRFFRWIASWILNTESSSIAAIVGLFGFGLFGSVCSSYIRRRLKRVKDTESGEQQIVMYDLSGQLINGLSAAIVVFLAVKGGSVVFVNGQASPNPYMLFFTCFVASVFSEDIWTWARTKLKESFDNDRSRGEEGDGSESESEGEGEGEGEETTNKDANDADEGTDNEEPPENKDEPQ